MITPSKSKIYSIRSNEERALKVPKFKHDTFGKRAFTVYGRLAWNCLPEEIGLCDEIEVFERNLKTHLFVKFVNESTLAIWFWRIIVKRPGMLSAQFVALYKLNKPKPCKPKPSCNKHGTVDQNKRDCKNQQCTILGDQKMLGCYESEPPRFCSAEIYLGISHAFLNTYWRQASPKF